MTGYVGPIESQTLKNTYFRQVLFTGKHAQLVAMSLLPGEEIGKDVHPNVDQVFRIEQGEAKVVFNEKEEHVLRDADAILVPAGTLDLLIHSLARDDRVFPRGPGFGFDRRHDRVVVRGVVMENSEPLDVGSSTKTNGLLPSRVAPTDRRRELFVRIRTVIDDEIGAFDEPEHVLIGTADDVLRVGHVAK